MMPRPLRPSWLLLLCVSSLAAACSEASPAEQPLSLLETASPAGEGSGEANLFASDGSVYLSWLEAVDDGRHALRFSAWEGDGWAPAGTIAEGEGFFVNWADFPSIIALPDGRLAAHWLVRSGPDTYAYDVHIAQSEDGGRTWSPAIVPHRDGTQTEHGFVSLFPWHDGSLSAVWLDGRNFEGAEHGSGAEMTLRHTVIRRDGALGEETLLDDRVCDCCQTSAALTSAGPLVVYRDRSADEIRDISVVRYVDGGWSEPQPVHRDGWHITGCPVNGPAAAAVGEQVAVAWFTAADESPRVLLAFSTDAGASFSEPYRIDDGDPAGRVGVVLTEDGVALVGWLERVGDDAEIRVRRVSPVTGPQDAHVISTSSAARASGFPRIARSGNDLFFAWTEPGEPSRVRTARARLP